MPSHSLFSRLFLVIGWILLPGTALLVGRLLWEQTLLTWAEGPQMIGFSLGHTRPDLFLLGFLSVGLSHVWVLVAVILIVAKSHYRRAAVFAILSLQCILVALLYVPYGTWQWLMVKTRGPGAHGNELLVFGAGFGNKLLVKELVNRGMDVNVRDESDATALMTASGAGDEDTVRFLLARGADVNAKTRSHNSTALMAAAGNGHLQVVKLLVASGADPKIENDRGLTAALLARDEGHHEVAEYLWGGRSSPQN